MTGSVASNPVPPSRSNRVGLPIPPAKPSVFSRPRFIIVTAAALAATAAGGYGWTQWRESVAAEKRAAAEAKSRFAEIKKPAIEIFTRNVQTITQALNDNGLCPTREIPLNDCNAGQRASGPEAEGYFYARKSWVHHTAQNHATLRYEVGVGYGSKPQVPNYELILRLSTAEGTAMKDFNPAAMTLVTRLAGDVLGDRSAAATIIEKCLTAPGTRIPDDRDGSAPISCSYGTVPKSPGPFSADHLYLRVTSKTGRNLNPG